MISHILSFRARLAALLVPLAVTTFAFAPPLAAQAPIASVSGSPAPGSSAPQSSAPSYPAIADVDPVAALSRYLRMLAANPRDLASLTGAGRAALAVGDANAALGFYARAEEIAPRNGRIKAGLATALVQMEQPRTALKLFGEAVALGVPESDIASDRGLANDLNGDNRRAQVDYTLALRAKDDDETLRRLALSMAISGDRSGALTMLDPLLRRRDSGAVRARAFVLALTGDQGGAANAVRGAMPGPQATVMANFMSRLAALNPAQKALAVNFGYFPSDGRAYTAAEMFAENRSAAPPASGTALAARDPRSDRRGDTPLIPAGEALGPRIVTAANDGDARAPRRRPGQMDVAAEILPPAHVLSAPIPGQTPPPSRVAARGMVGAVQTGIAPARLPAAVPGAATVPPDVRPQAVFAPTGTAGAAAFGTVAGTLAPAAVLPGVSGPVPVIARPVGTAASALPQSAAASPVAPSIALAVPDQAVAVAPAVVGSTRLPIDPASSPAPVVPSPVVASAGVAVTPPAGAGSPAVTPPGSLVITARGPALARATAPPFATGGRPDPRPETPPPAVEPAAAIKPVAERTKLAMVDEKAVAKPAGTKAGAGRSAVDTVKTPARDRAGDTAKPAPKDKESAAKDRAAKPDPKDKAAAARLAAREKAGIDKGSIDKADKAGVGKDGKAKADAKAKTDAKGKAADKGKPETKAAAKAAKVPERYWVQVASGSNKANLDKAWTNVKGKAPKMLAGKATYTAPWRASNRLLIGPFKSEDEAQAQVNTLAKAGVSGIQFTTRAGTDVEKVAAK